MLNKYLFALCACLNMLSSQAQISITSAEMPHAGDTARLTKAVNNPFLNYSATGANHNWNFATLKADTQDLRQFHNVSSTGLLYAITFADIFFNANRANVATSGGLTIPANSYLTLDNPYNFFYRNNSQYRQVGIGSDVTAFGISLGGIPTVFDQFDVIYNLPLNFGDQDTSNSAYHISLPLVPISYAFRQTRINNVDGWGILQTPHGTYDVLRVKTTLLAHDSLGFDTLGIPPIEIDRPLVNEYKWLAANEVVPVMQVNTQTLFGLEVITDIFFRDDFLNVYPGTLNNSYCAGSTFSIPYTAEGTFNTGGILIPANQFRAQLSDATGSFANPVQIGQVTSNVSGTINATIPFNTPEGGGYRIRIIATSPGIVGADNGTDINITTQPVSVISTNGGSTICDSTGINLIATPGTNYTYQWQLNGVDIAGETSISYTATQTGDYTIVTSNMCGTVTSNIIHVDASITPVAQINSAANIFCAGDSLLISTNYENGLTYQWLLDGAVITGATDTVMYALLAGNYSLIVNNGGCLDTSATFPVTIQNLATVNIATSGDSVICAGDSVILIETAAAGVSYQWQLNGIDIPGEINSMLAAYQTGDYMVIATNMCGPATSNNIHIEVTTPPTASITSASTSYCAGDSLLINALYENGNIYQWMLDGSAIVNSTDTLLYATQPGTYSVVVIGNGVCPAVTSNGIVVTVLSAPVPNITASGNTTLCAGDSVVLNETSASGSTYQWQLDSVDISGATLNSFAATQSGSYSIVVGNSCGNANSNSINVIVNPLPPVPVIAQQIDTLISSSAFAYQWYLNGILIAGANGQYYIPTQNGDYTVVVTDANGCTNTSAIFTFNTLGVHEVSSTYMVTVTPNPVNDFFNLDFNSEKGSTISVSLISSTGAKIILSDKQKMFSGTNHLIFDLKPLSLASGIYFVKIDSDVSVVYKKMIKN